MPEVIGFVTKWISHLLVVVGVAMLVVIMIMWLLVEGVFVLMDGRR